MYRLLPEVDPTFLYAFSTETSSGTNSDGGYCEAALIEGNDGTFYGTTSQSGANGTGTIFEISVAPRAITSPAAATAKVGQPFSYQITTTNNSSSYSVMGLPTGLSANATPGLISGTPTAAGTKTLTLEASNAGGTGQQTLTLTIKGS